jgi:glycosyltransferase-like protein
MNCPLRIAILTHSTNPRGGVVHALALGEALASLGHAVTVFAPDPMQTGFFRKTLCGTVGIPAAPVARDLRSMVQTRIADYVRYFEQVDNRQFDVWHAQDGISGNALATLKIGGLIEGFARTVHHLDAFEDETINALQARAIKAADRLFTVSGLWRDYLAREFGCKAVQVGNGVDTARFSPRTNETDRVLRDRLGLTAEMHVFLAVGGVEQRKNTIRLLQAFQILHAQHPASRLLIAGGASILDHNAYQAGFGGVLAQDKASAAAVLQTGPLDDRLMPALYRAAATLVLPSITEGFGLVVLEAMASGVPVVTSEIAPFTEYLGRNDALWCDPFDIPSIAAAMTDSLDASRRAGLIKSGVVVAARHDWMTTARHHLASYEMLREKAYA